MSFDKSVCSSHTAIIAEIKEFPNSQIKMGNIHPILNGLSMTWAHCPLSVAFKVAAKSKFRVG